MNNGAVSTLYRHEDFGMNNTEKEYIQNMAMVDRMKADPYILNKLVEDYFNPENGHVSQQYADWIKSEEYTELRSRGIHLNINEHTTATPAEIVAEFERVWEQFQKDFENGTLEEVTDLD